MAISAKNISKTFDGGHTFALQDVSLEIPAGEFVAVVGLSGAGKSTFLRCINGTCVPSQGSMTVLGREMTQATPLERRELRKEIGFIFQQFNLIKSVSALKNVLVGRIAFSPLWRALTGWYAEDDIALAKRTLDSVGLEGRYEERARNLSGGQQQRVAIARALVQQPKIILADEPMASLDPKLSEVVLEILSKVNRDLGITVLVNLHVLEYARKYAKRIIAFQKGRVVFDGTPKELTAEVIERIYTVGPTTEQVARMAMTAVPRTGTAAAEVTA